MVYDQETGSKILFTIGNLYTGYPWGVEAERQFGTVDLHGPFSTESEANTYMHGLIQGDFRPEDGMRYLSVKVVRIETPQAGRLITYTGRGEHDGYEYATA